MIFLILEHNSCDLSTAILYNKNIVKVMDGSILINLYMVALGVVSVL